MMVCGDPVITVLVAAAAWSETTDATATMNGIGRPAVSLLLLLLESAVVAGATEPRSALFATLSQDEIHPGAPLYVRISIARDDSGPEEAVSVSISSFFDRVKLQILNGDGEAAPGRPDAPWTPGVLGFSTSKSLLPGESLEKTVIVHRWATTALPPGEYTVRVTVAARYRLDSDSAEYKPISDGPFQADLPLRVLDPDPEQVRRTFIDLAERSTDDTVPVPERTLALDSLILAQGPLALPGQLRLTEHLAMDRVLADGDLRDLTMMYWYIVKTGDAGTARSLVEFTERPAIQELAAGPAPDVKGVWTILRWAIHELHRTGSSDVQRATRDFVSAYNEPEPFIGRIFMHGAGIRAPRDY